MLRIDTNITDRRKHIAVAVSIASGNKQGISREIKVHSEAELKEVLDYFNKDLEAELTKRIHDFADRKENNT